MLKAKGGKRTSGPGWQRSVRVCKVSSELSGSADGPSRQPTENAMAEMNRLRTGTVRAPINT